MRWKSVRKEPLYRIRLVPFNDIAEVASTEQELSYSQSTNVSQEIEGHSPKKDKKTDTWRTFPLLNFNGHDVSNERLPPNPAHNDYNGIVKDIGIEFIDHALGSDRDVSQDEIDRLCSEKMTSVYPAHFPLASINQVNNLSTNCDN